MSSLEDLKRNRRSFDDRLNELEDKVMLFACTVDSNRERIETLEKKGANDEEEGLYLVPDDQDMQSKGTDGEDEEFIQPDGQAMTGA